MTAPGRRIAVIGAGIVGSSVAYELALAGCDVTVYDSEPADSTHCASFGNAGILALSFAKPMSNPRMLWRGVRSLATGGHDVDFAQPLGRSTMRWMLRFGVESRPFRARRAAHEVFSTARQSLDLYTALEQRESLDLGLRRTGWLYVGRDREAVEQQARAAGELAPVGVRSEVKAAAELRELVPGLAADLAGGVFYPDDVTMRPAQLVAVVRQAARQRGVSFEQARITGFHQHDGRVGWAATERGETLTADQFVIATGAESPLLGGLLGTHVPVTRGTGWSLTLPTEEPLAGLAVMGIEDHVVINPQQDCVRITGGMRFGGPTDQQATNAEIAQLRASAEAVLPAIRDIAAEGVSWTGARPMTPSGLPFVRRVNASAVVATGHGTLGMTLAPHTAQTVRRLVLT